MKAGDRTGYKTGYLVIDAMTTHPITVGPQDTLQDAARLMAEHDVGSLVVKERHALLGVLTEFDLVRKALANALDVKSRKVEELMTRDLVTVSPGMDVLDAIRLMRDAGVRHLPVMDEGNMVGFITLKDILKIQPQLFDIVVERLRLREEERKLLRFAGEEEEY